METLVRYPYAESSLSASATCLTPRLDPSTSCATLPTLAFAFSVNVNAIALSLDASHQTFGFPVACSEYLP
jgi:hypothetical protein